MNKKQIFLSICLFIVFFSLLSVASASDTTENVTVTAVSDDSNTISVTNNQDYTLGANPGSFTNLNTTVSDSQAEESINLTMDYTYSSSDGNFSEGILIDKSITIDGQGRTINAQGNASIFNIQGNSKVILKNIKFINAVGVNGSAIKLGSSAQLEIIKCTFNNNVAQMCGGAIYVADSSSLTSNLIINGSTFNGNSARFGGAIYWTGDYGSLIDSKFTRNSADQDGGAIYWEGHNGLIKGSTFEYNTVSGVLNSDKNVTRHNDDTGIDEIHYDILGGDGGAIIWKGSDAIIEDSTFNNNYAPYRGGAIFFTGMEGENCTNVTIKNANFNKNHAAMNGGAIDWASGASNATIIGSHFINNVADRSAGAIYVRGDGLEIKDSEFKNNKLTGNTLYDNRTNGMTFTSIGGNGGAICWMGSYGTVDNVIFTDNVASQRGGAIQFERNVNGTVKNSRFTNNRAGTEGGAIDFYNGAENGKIINSNFTNNVAGDNGGAIFWQGHYGTITGSRFESNKAVGLGNGVSISNTTNPNTNASEERFNITGGDGGAIKWTGSHGIISNSQFIKNNAAYNGGAIYLTGNETENCTNITFNGCEFTSNQAKLNGGALFWASGASNATIIGSLFKLNTAARTAGAIYINGNYLEIKDTEFRQNSALRSQTYDNRNGSSFFTSLGGNAGAICWMGSYGTVDNGTFISNTAEDRGGAIQFERNENGTVKNSYFEKNTAKGDGGAIDWYQGAVNGQLINSTFKSNSISGYGGSGAGVYIEGYNATIRDSRFDNHKTNSDGGAIYVAGDECKIFNSNFTNNVVGDDGGAIYWEGDNGYIYNITCVNNRCTSMTKEDGVNTSSSRGGTLSLIGDNVTVEKSVFNKSSVSIASNKDPSKVDGGAIFITGNDVSILDTSVYDCSAVDAGGAFYVIGNYTQIVNCTITKTSADNGGAVYIEGHNITISELSSDLSTANTRGGSIYVEGYGAYIENSSFTSNTGLIGGAIYIAGDDVVVNSSTFTSNKGKGKKTADGGSGGAIYIDGEGATILGSDFISDYAVRYGGAIAVWGANANITSNTFKDCTVDINDGGAIFVKGLNTTISESNFSKSIAKAGNGGAIGVQGDDAHILDCNFTECKASSTNSRGGAIDIEGHRTLVSDSIFEGCYAHDGGDIYVFGNNVKMQDSLFDSSTAAKGGAIFVWGWGAIIENSNLTNCNASQSGGAIYTTQSGGTRILDNNFDSCVAKGTATSQGGGAIYVEGPNTFISGSNFTNNKASSGSARGGTIYINGNDTIVEKSHFNNSISNQGGIIHVNGENAIIDSSVFANSSSKGFGGAISVLGSNAAIENSQFENFKANGNGGAIYVNGKDTQILHSSFDNCTTTGYNNRGGVIFIDNVGTNVWYSNFTNSKSNTAGAIFINGKDTVISYCNLDNNTAHSAGAISVHGNNTILSNNNFTNNIADSGSGGALDMSGDNASVYYSFFDNNRAASNGGAINWDGGHGSDSIIGCTFTNNDCNNTLQGGGAIFWTAGEIGHIGSGGLIQDSKFINNTANGRHGGAINWYHAKDSVINNCLFVNNTAASDGGALYTGHQTGGGFNLTMTNCQFYNNTAHKHGGAIANQMEGSWIYNNTFDGNKAQASGGTILMKESYAFNSVIDHCYIYNSFVNQSYGDPQYGEGGGAIRIDDANITITNCAIYNSVANNTYGGAILVRSVNASLINVSIENTATLNDNGGAIYWAGNNGYMENVTIFNSSSNSLGKKDANGGAIYLSGIDCNFTNITITSSSSNNPNNESSKSAHGGAIYVLGGSYYGYGNTISNIIIDNATSSSDNFKSDGGAIYWAGTSGSLVNATISNTLANGKGGAIYWSGSSDVVDNISIEYSRTNVTNSSESADGGAIYSTGINNLTNVYISASIASKDKGDIKGGAIFYNGAEMSNITVVRSRASTENGTSFGGAIFWDGSAVGNLHNATFEENHADLGGAVYSTRTTNIYDASFKGNVAEDGGALYGAKNDDILTNVSFIHNSAKRGGAIFTDNVQINMFDSTLINNTAEASGAALYHNYVDKAGNSEIANTQMLNNTAYKGSAVYATDFKNFKMKDVVLLDNQANANRFTEKTVGVLANGSNYTSAIFLGNDNLLNSMWLEGGSNLYCDNVTYLGTNGITSITGNPDLSNQDVRQNVTVYMFNKKGKLLDKQDLVTDSSGKFIYTFNAEKGEIYNFAYEHKSDRYYTYLRDTYSNSSLVEMWINNCTYGENASALISLTDGAWGNLSGNVTVEINDTKHTTFTVEIINSTLTYYNITGLPVGHYNATATFKGNLTRLGDTEWVLFEVRPYTDLNITKEVDVIGDYVNVTDSITYTVKVWNKGPTASWDVNVTEILSPYLKLLENHTSKGHYDLTNNGTWFIGDLAVDEIVTLTIKAQVIHKGLIANNVWVDGAGREINFTDNVASARNLTAVAYVDLRISKTVDAPLIVNVNDVIKYTVTVFNAGPCNATGVFVGEDLDSRLKLISSNPSVGKYEKGTWNIGNLTAGASETLTIEAQVIYSGVIVNKVNVTTYDNDTNLTNNYANVTNIAIANVDLQINKTANVTTPVSVNDKIKFTISVYNAGPCNATGVYVGEEIKFPLKFISANATIGEYKDGTWVINGLNKGELHNLTIIAQVISTGKIENYVFITSADNDTNHTNDHANYTNVAVENMVDVAISKYLMNNTAYVGEDIVYYIEVENKGPATATQVIVRENISEFVKVIDASDSNYDKTKHIWNIGNLTKGESKLLKLTVKVLDEGIVKNSVNVTSHEKDTNMSNNNASASDILVIKKAEFDIIKTSNLTGDAYVNDLVNFTITFTNKGPSNATEIIVTDELPDGLTYVDSGSSTGAKGVHYTVSGKDYVDWNIGDLDVGEGASVWVVVKAMTNGTFENVAVVKPKEYSPNNSNKTNITVLPAVDLDINKTAITIPARDTVYVGDEITFVVYVKNNGPCNATGVVVKENVTGLVEIIGVFPSVGTSYDQDAGLWTIGNLGVGDIAGLMINVKVISNGTVENVVSVTSNEKDINGSNNNASSNNITALPLVDVKVNKTVSVSEVKLGDNITYTIKVQNNGLCDATNVNVTGKLSNNVVCIQSNPSKGNYDAVKNIWYIGKLTKGSTETLTLTVKAVEVGTVENSVIVNSTEKDSNLTNNNYTCDNVTVTRLDTPIDLYTYNITYGEDEVLVVTLPTNATGTVNITVANRTYNDVPIDNGRVQLPVTDLAGGDYTVDVVYGGDGKYLPNSTSGIFNVAPLTPIIKIQVEDIWVWEVEVLNVTVNAPGTVFVTVNNKTVEIPLDNGIVSTDVLAASAKPDYKGNATWNIINLPAGTYPAFALYPGNENYTSVNTSDVFHVRELIPTFVIAVADDIYVGEDAVIDIAVGPYGVTGNVTVNVDGTNYTVPLEDGQATLIVPDLKAGKKKVTVWYEGNLIYLPSKNTTTFNVLKLVPPVDIDAPTITVGEDGIIIVTVPDDATGTITIEINGKRYTQPIEDGEAIFIIPGLKVGVHDIIAFYSGDDKYLPANNTGEIEVLPDDEPDHHNDTPKKSTIEHKMYETGNPIMALIAVLMSICLVQIRRFKK